MKADYEINNLLESFSEAVWACVNDVPKIT